MTAPLFTCLILCWGEVKQFYNPIFGSIRHVIRRVCSLRGNRACSEQGRFRCFWPAPSAILVVKWYPDTLVGRASCGYVVLLKNKELGGLVLKEVDRGIETRAGGSGILWHSAPRSPAPAPPPSALVPHLAPQTAGTASVGMRVSRL